MSGAFSYETSFGSSNILRVRRKMTLYAFLNSSTHIFQIEKKKIRDFGDNVLCGYSMLMRLVQGGPVAVSLMFMEAVSLRVERRCPNHLKGTTRAQFRIYQSCRLLVVFERVAEMEFQGSLTDRFCVRSFYNK